MRVATGNRIQHGFWVFRALGFVGLRVWNFRAGRVFSIFGLYVSKGPFFKGSIGLQTPSDGVCTGALQEL